MGGEGCALITRNKRRCLAARLGGLGRQVGRLGSRQADQVKPGNSLVQWHG